MLVCLKHDAYCQVEEGAICGQYHMALLQRPYRLGCAVIFASKRIEAKRKRNFFRFDAKKVRFSLVSHRCETYKSEAKRKWNEAKTKPKRSEKLPSFSL